MTDAVRSAAARIPRDARVLPAVLLALAALVPPALVARETVRNAVDG